MIVPQTEIIISKDGVEIARKTVTPGEYVIGRGGDADLLMDTPLASRHHARLTVNYDEWLIEDLGSANGTFINEQPVPANETTRVFPTQSLRVGDATVALRRLRGSEAPDSSLAPSVAAVRTLLPEELRERRYAVGKVVAQGGMGAILSAQDQAIRRGVAMKVMLQSGDAGDVARFVEEAQITGQLEHPNIVPVHELGVDEQEQVFYTMKFVNGITLKKVLELLVSGVEGTIRKYPLGTLLTVFQKVCDAIAFAHAKGVIHRDLKPENVMIGDFGEVLVMDWGLAKVLGAPKGAKSQRPTVVSVRQTDGSGSVTMAGSIMGTPQYMAPEQARGEVETMDQRADIYALGAILYHLLALRPSVADGDAMTIVGKVALGVIEPLIGPAGATVRAKPGAPGARVLSHLPGGRIPDSLAAVVRKAMAFEPAARYASVPELQADLEAYQNGFATSAEKAGLGKQIVLAIRRNKVASAAAAIILVLSAGFIVKVIASEKRAQQSLARLRETAPTFASNARALIEKAVTEPTALDEALKNIDYAIDLAPRERSYALTKAGIFLAQQRLDEARALFAAVQAREPGQAEAKAGLALCDRLIAQRLSDGRYSQATLSELAAALREQGRTGEALFVMRDLAGAGKERLATITAALRKAGLDRTPGLDGSELRLDLSGNQELFDIALLRGMPLTRLYLNNTGVSDLTPLAGMPLTFLSMVNARVTDLSPLRGLPLRELHIDGQVQSLEPLRGAPLEKLSLNHNQRRVVTTGFEVLRDMPLKELRLGTTGFADLRLLAGKSFTILDLSNTGITDLTPLRDLTVENLQLSTMNRINPGNLAFLAGQKALRVLNAAENRSLTDLSALRGLALEELSLSGTAVTDLSPLAGSTISSLSLPSTPFTEVGQLAALPNLKAVDLRGTAISDLSPLAGTSIQRLQLADCLGVRSAAPLAGIEGLRVVGLPVHVRDVEPLRALKSLQWIGYRNDGPQLADAAKRIGELRDFWQMHDREKQLRAAEPDGRLRPGKFPDMAARFPAARELNGHWYLFLRGKYTWEAARRLAEDLGGHLATIGTEEEFDFARKATSVSANQVVWLGGLQDEPGGPWRWVNSEPWKGTPWANKKDGTSEPDGRNHQGQPETRLAIGHFGATQVSPPGISDVAADYAGVSGLLIEWED